MSNRMLLSGIWLAGSLVAQVQRASIVGTVTDKSGSVISGAVVKITHESTNTSASLLSGDAGNYSACVPAAVQVGHGRPEHPHWSADLQLRPDADQEHPVLRSAPADLPDRVLQRVQHAAIHAAREPDRGYRRRNHLGDRPALAANSVRAQAGVLNCGLQSSRTTIEVGRVPCYLANKIGLPACRIHGEATRGTTQASGVRIHLCEMSPGFRVDCNDGVRVSDGAREVIEDVPVLFPCRGHTASVIGKSLTRFDLLTGNERRQPDFG
jgi:hypothetical protein